MAHAIMAADLMPRSGGSAARAAPGRTCLRGSIRCLIRLDRWIATSGPRCLTRRPRSGWNRRRGGSGVSPQGAGVAVAAGASAIIARIPTLVAADNVQIAGPTYNEHRAAFAANGWQITEGPGTARVAVNPNNPDGRLWTVKTATQGAPTLVVIDESFCDVIPERSLMELATRPGVLILKSFGKFWGLAGLRLGFAIGDPVLTARLAATLGPWPVSGPAIRIGTRALADPDWTCATRRRLRQEADRLDAVMVRAGAAVVGGTTLFRLYETDDARAWQSRLAEAHIWTRVFPYSKTWLRLGLPAPTGWTRLETVL